MATKKFSNKTMAQTFAARCRRNGYRVTTSKVKDINKKKKGNQPGYSVSYNK